MTVEATGAGSVLKDLFYPSSEAEIRLLLLIDAFTTPKNNLDGRTKLAKLDFFLRYPNYLQRALDIRVGAEAAAEVTAENNIESTMVRYRYGPWDPAYFALLGRLVGRGLIKSVQASHGYGYRTTAKGVEVAADARDYRAWKDVHHRTRLLKRYFDRSGTFLKDFIYKHFPEVSEAKIGEEL